jgi:hypothetical protein
MVTHLDLGYLRGNNTHNGGLEWFPKLALVEKSSREFSLVLRPPGFVLLVSFLSHPSSFPPTFVALGIHPCATPFCKLLLP